MCVDSSNQEADERTVAYYSKETVPRKTVVIVQSRKSLKESAVEWVRGFLCGHMCSNFRIKTPDQWLWTLFKCYYYQVLDYGLYSLFIADLEELFATRYFCPWYLKNVAFFQSDAVFLFQSDS